LVKFLSKIVFNKILAIVISFLAVIFIIALITYFGGSVIEKQFQDLLKDFTVYYQILSTNIENTINNDNVFMSFLAEFNLQQKITSVLNNIISTIRNNIIGFFSAVTNIGTILILIPFVLFYFLKDDKLIYSTIINKFPTQKQKSVQKILLEIDQTLAIYIGGRLIIAILLGVLTLIGFLIIDLPNALILAVMVMITSFIPIIGPIIGNLPALFIAVTSNMLLVIKVLIVITIVQQLEGNVIQPNVLGERLKIHPLVIIFSILIFTILFGFIGALFAVPVYTILRILIEHYIKYKRVD
jgi:predicted PurR-regulated permease PerM